MRPTSSPIQDLVAYLASRRTDDPYYFLSSPREASYFELETQVLPQGGLVVRFDSFSKVLASGMRLVSSIPREYAVIPSAIV